MGIVLTVLEPPHLPEPNLVTALPPEVGRVIDAEPRLVSPRYDTLLVTTRGLVVRDHVSGDFSGIPWANFSLDAHLQQHSRHAILLLWLDERRPVEVAITRRLALNIASVAPVLKSNPTASVDDVVLADRLPDVYDLRDSVRIDAPAPQTADRVDRVPPPKPPPPARRRVDGSLRRHSPPPARPRPRRLLRLVAGAAVLVAAGVAGAVASIAINTADSLADGSAPMISSEAVEAGPFDR
ncbi:MAG: hypothetical protein OES24_10655 [Acidimicrobiia bacterium]|nr:hypothetical protein [Acidimicrobiia bacterium]